MAENQTVATKASVSGFLAKVSGQTETSRQPGAGKDDAGGLGRERATMWGPAIVGFGSMHYKYASGREGDMPLIGFSPRKQNLTLYIGGGFENYKELLARLGKYTTSKVCLYVKRLDDVHLPTLKKLVRGASLQVIRKQSK